MAVREVGRGGGADVEKDRAPYLGERGLLLVEESWRAIRDDFRNFFGSAECLELAQRVP